MHARSSPASASRKIPIDDPAAQVQSQLRASGEGVKSQVDATWPFKCHILGEYIMSIISFVLAIVSLLGYAAFAYQNASPGWLYFSSLLIGVVAAILGFLARGKPWAKSGLTLGIIDTLIGIALFLWLFGLSPSVSG